jgi:hypothetical protein
MSRRDMGICSSTIPARSGPGRFNFDRSYFSGRVVAKARPRPIFGTIAEVLSYGVAVDVVQLLIKLIMVADVEVVVSVLPEMRSIANVFSGDALLKRLDSDGERFDVWLAEKQMHMIRHHYISVDAEMEAASDPLESFKKGLFCCSVG